MIIVHATIPVAAEHRERISLELGAFAVQTRREAGCVACRISADLEGRHDFFMLQQWRDMDALREHYATEHLATLLAALSAAAVKAIDTQRFEVSDADPAAPPAAPPAQVLH